MKAHTASLINAVTLVAMGLWGAIGATSPTAWIPVVGGVILLALNNGVKKENKVIAHIAVLLTLLLAIGLLRPMMSAFGEGGTAVKQIRSVLMVGTTIFAMVYFVKSFIDARKARENG